MTTSEAISGMNLAGRTSSVKNGSNTNSTSRDLGALDFGSIMNSSLASKTNSKDSSLYTNVADKSQTKTQVKDNETDNQQPVKTENKSDSVSQVSKNETKTDDLDNADKIETMLDDIKQKIKDTLGITDEELEAALSVLGLTLQDLLNPADLTQFVVQVKGYDGAISLITDSDLSEQFKDIMNFINEQVEQLADEMNMTPQEVLEYVDETVGQDTFSDVLQDAAVQIESPETDELMEELPKEDLRQPVQTEVTSDAATVQTDTLDKKITVETQQQENGGQSADSQQPKSETAEHQVSTADIAANLTQSINDTFGEVITQNVHHVDAADIVQQIIDSVKVITTQNLQSMEIQLNPENLGKIHLIVTSKDGIMTAQLTAQDEAVKKAIESQLAQLKENFNNQGLKVQNVEVAVESHAYDQNRDLAGNDRQEHEAGQNRRKHLNLDSLMGFDEEELTEDEKHAMELLKNEGSSVSYTA